MVFPSLLPESTVLTPSIMRESSLPEAIFDKGLGGSPGLAEIKIEFHHSHNDLGRRLTAAPKTEARHIQKKALLLAFPTKKIFAAFFSCFGNSLRQGLVYAFPPVHIPYEVPASVRQERDGF